MNTNQIETNVNELIKNFNKKEFIFELLLAYGISKTSISRLKKGDFNLSKVEGEILYKSKLLFKEVSSGNLLTIIDNLTKEPESLKHNPRFVIVTDYHTLLAKDIRTGATLDTTILELHKHFSFFLPWAGQEKYTQANENYADRKASYKMAKLYDILVSENPSIYDDGGHRLNIFLSRLLFCFFAEDTGIFSLEGVFTDTLEQHTQKDGSDTHIFLDRLFKVLNTEDNSKEASHFKSFPYVNGGLFRDTIVSPKFTKEARNIIIECGDLDWSEINPDIFGSMIQAVVNPAYRSGLGMHYTSVPNIMKVIEPLFLNELYDEFEKCKGNAKKLRNLIHRVSKLKIFDPACGSGNFLIIAYKELRKLEIKILKEIYSLEKQQSIVFTEIKLSQFYGIELDDFAHEMAILSLWLAEHQMNKIFVDELQGFGQAKPILPLKEAGHITQGNATRLNWEDICPKNNGDEIYILGNPPYLGFLLQTKENKKDMDIVFQNKSNMKKLDYISCWFYIGAKYIEGFNAQLAFVSTNSISQGEQVALLWPDILKNLEIGFAYTSFKWINNAKGNAGVTVVIIGLRNISNKPKYIYAENIKDNVQNINAYLSPSSNVYITKLTSPISNFPTISLGSAAYDGGHLMISKTERKSIIDKYPESERLFKKFVGSAEFLNGIERYCLWIEDEDLYIANSIFEIKTKLDCVQSFRKNSKRIQTLKTVNIPHRFTEDRHKESASLLIPIVASERRTHLVLGFLDSGEVIPNSARAIYNIEPYMFGILSSYMHILWVKAVGGKLKTDYRYSAGICYNSFPFPEINQKQKEQINLHVFEVLEEREKHSGKTLAQLYDPDKMPKGLKEAHHQLDLAIERCYRLKPFESDTERLEYLFKEYEKMINKNTLLEKPKKPRKQK